MMNIREIQFVDDMRDAMSYIPGDYELEMNHFNTFDDDGKPIPQLCGWYAWMYTGRETVPINQDYQEAPLITDEEVEKYKVNPFGCFEYIDCYVCG